MIRIREYIRMMICARRVSRQQPVDISKVRPGTYIVVDRGLYLQLLEQADELTCLGIKIVHAQQDQDQETCCALRPQSIVSMHRRK